jgi:hypothetical protein
MGRAALAVSLVPVAAQAAGAAGAEEVVVGLAAGAAAAVLVGVGAVPAVAVVQAPAVVVVRAPVVVVRAPAVAADGRGPLNRSGYESRRGCAALVSNIHARAGSLPRRAFATLDVSVLGAFVASSVRATHLASHCAAFMAIPFLARLLPARRLCCAAKAKIASAEIEPSFVPLADLLRNH